MGRRNADDLKAYAETGCPSERKRRQLTGADPRNRLVLMNAAFTAAGGIALSIASPRGGKLDAVGAGLTGYAALMTRIAGRGVTRRAARLFAALDVAWVLGTVAVVAAFWSWFGRPGALERARDVDRGRRFRRGAVPRGGILRDA